jgi:lantibiotic modifying enzyme
MNATLSVRTLPLNWFARIRELLELVDAIRQITHPITTAEGLRQSIDLLVRLAQLAGVDPRWIKRLEQIRDDEAVMRIVLAIARYVFERVVHRSEEEAVFVSLGDGDDEVAVTTKDFLEWLPVIIQIISLLREIRRGGV